MTNDERNAHLLTILKHVRDFCRVAGQIDDAALKALVEVVPGQPEDFEAAARSFEQGRLAYAIMAQLCRARKAN